MTVNQLKLLYTYCAFSFWYGTTVLCRALLQLVSVLFSIKLLLSLLYSTWKFLIFQYSYLYKKIEIAIPSYPHLAVSPLENATYTPTHAGPQPSQIKLPYIASPCTAVGMQISSKDIILQILWLLGFPQNFILSIHVQGIVIQRDS